MKRNLWADLVLFMLASPILLVLFLHRSWRHLQFLKVATLPWIVCPCGRRVSLVGMWRCGCGFTYRGHLVRMCPVCGRLPVMVRCYGCGLTMKLPEPSYGADH